MTRRRLLVLVPLLLLIAAAAYTAWLLLQVRADLRDAQAGVERLQAALEDDDPAARDEAAADLREAASRAADRTDGAWWSAMTVAPLIGDDAEGVRALSGSLDTVAGDGVDPLLRVVDLLDRVQGKDGRVDLEVIRDLAGPVGEARAAFGEASDEVAALDSSGYAGAIRGRFDEYVDRVGDADRALASADTAAEVLPGMLGGEGPRDYLLVFQNNAEIRATGGMPGSWAQLHADNGKLSLGRQGSAGDFPHTEEPILPLSDAELKVYDRQLGTYFQDVGFTPDFPRSAELINAHWAAKYPADRLDGVLALDPVAMSYLLEGTGPVQVGETTLTPDNAVEELLSRPYLELQPAAQDAFFQVAAGAVFEAATGHLASPMEFVEGMRRAADEGRFLVAPFRPDEAKALAGSQVLGELPGDDGATPHVDIDLNDATGSKMSYYLRYNAEVRASGCEDGAQSLSGTMTFAQSIPPNEAADLPESVTGTADFGTAQGSQLVLVRVHGPHGGTIDKIRMDGKAINVKPVDLDGRPTVTLVVLLSSTDDVVVNWSMATGEGQTDDGELGVTPGIVPGSKDKLIPSAC